MRKVTLLAIALGGCMAVGPTRIGLVPAMAPIGESRDPDPMHAPDPSAHAAGPSAGDEGVARIDPVTLGPLSGAVTGTTLLLNILTGTPALVGVYGKFDENRLVAPGAGPTPAVPPTEP